MPERRSTRSLVPPRPTGRDPSASAARGRRTAELFAALMQTADERRRAQLVDEVIRLHLVVAWSIASTYRGRSLSDDDLRQSAYEGLVKAARRFDPALGHDFLGFAAPTILGEVQRLFRNSAWVVRPPRRIQELARRRSLVDAELLQRHRREPNGAELCAALGVSARELAELLPSGHAFRPVSLDRPHPGRGDRDEYDLLPVDDAALAACEARVVVLPAIRTLCDVDRKIVYRRFYEGWAQSEIAAELGVSQMQVSRMLSRILRRLRTIIGDPERTASGHAA